MERTKRRKEDNVGDKKGVRADDGARNGKGSIGLDITHASGARNKQLGGSTVQTPVTLITPEIPAAAGVPKSDRSLGRKCAPDTRFGNSRNPPASPCGPFIPVGLYLVDLVSSPLSIYGFSYNGFYCWMLVLLRARNGADD